MITLVIIAITVVVSFLCFNNQSLFEKLSLKPYKVVHANEWYRLISHGFVHADWMHLFVNMFTYYSFGEFMEVWFRDYGFGNGIYFVLYFGGMLVASLPDVIRYRNATWYSSIGASGAVSAILFSFIFLYPWHKILLFAVIPIPGIVFGVLYLIYCQYMAKRGADNINHNAHFYGAVFGFLLPGVIEPSLFKEFFHELLSFNLF